MFKTKLILIFIIVIAIILRFWQLGNVPISPDWDEASLAYNAYSILNTGRDEYGKLLPISLESFGDYKPALYAYLAIPSIFLFDISTFAIRFPSAVIGAISVLLTFLLVKELFKNEKIALLSSFVLAISPWHIQFSRTAFEANLGVFLNILTALLFIKGLKRPYLLFCSAITSGLSIYTYQSEKIFAPLFMLLLVIIFRNELKEIGKKYFVPFFVIGFLVVIPLLVSTVLNPQSLNRARSTSFIAESKFFSHTPERVSVDKENNDYLGIVIDNRRVVYLKQSIGAYLSHFNPNWLFIQGDLPRHHAPNMGLLYHLELPLLLIGLYSLVFGKFSRKTKLFIFSWFLIAPIPASVTNDVPHAVRTLNFLPTYQIFTALGIYSALLWLFNLKAKYLKYSVLFVVCLGILFNFLYYLNQYFSQQNYYYSKDWQYGYEEAVRFVLSQKDYEKVIVSNQVPLDQSYIFFLFYSKYPPTDFQNAKTSVGNHNFDRYEFREIDWRKDQSLENTLFVGRAEDIEGGEILKKINYLNGETAIVIAKP